MLGTGAASELEPQAAAQRPAPKTAAAAPATAGEDCNSLLGTDGSPLIPGNMPLEMVRLALNS